MVYLTFDDGPSEWTEEFLDVLQQYGVKATFLMQGSNLQRKDLQSVVKRAADEGHYIGGRIDARKAANTAGSSGDHRILRRRRLPIWCLRR